jgi:N utilization substance protein B
MSDSGEIEQPPANGQTSPGQSKRARQPARGSRPRGSGTPARLSGSRHQARILALQVLYEVDVTDHELADVLVRSTEDSDEAITPAVRAHVDRLVRGSLEQRQDIDKYIADAAPAFPVSQLPAVDRNVLRLAIYELLSEPEVPPKAAINEAVELAKRFGGMNSSRFVNGVLGTVTVRLGPAESADTSDATDADSASN